MNTNKLQRPSIFIKKSILPFQVSKLYFDRKQNKLWIGTLSNGLFWYSFKTKQLKRINVSTFPKQPILAIEANSDSTLLVGIDGQGVWELNKSTERIVNVYKEDADDSFSLRGDGVYDILCDQNKRVWVSTFSGGISFFEQTSPLIKHISHYVNNSNSLGNNFINKVLEDRNGNIWFATNNGISKWDIKTNRWTTYYQNKKEQAQVFLSLCEDNKGRIWAGTYSTGVYVIDSNSGREVAHFSQNDKNSSLTSNFVFDIFKDSQGDIWIGGVQGDIVSYKMNENVFRSFTGRPINAFIELTADKILLVCTFGLAQLNKKTGEEEILLDGYWSNDAVVIGENVWVCTRGEGLIRFNLKNKKMEKYTTKNGLPSNYINSLIKLGNYLWLGTENGLCKFNTIDHSVLTYSSLLSLSKVSFNQSSHYVLRNGDLIWGTNNGAILFNPADVQYSKVKGKIYLQDILVSGRSLRDSSILHLTTPLDSLKEIKLKYNQNNLQLELLPIGTSVSDTKFTWQMEGLDASWNPPVNHRIVTYTNLSSGHFKLKIRMFDSSMTQIIDERTIDITVIPPFWKSWWFLLILFVFTIAVIYFSLRYYIDYLRRLHTEEKVKFFTNTAHDMRTSLTLINAPIEELKKELSLSSVGKYYLQIAVEQTRRLSLVVTQLMDFQKVDIGKEHILLHMVDVVKLVSRQKMMFDSFAQAKGIEIILNLNQSSYLTAIDETMMEKVIDNLVSNAIKYSHKDSKVFVNLTCNDTNWVLEVKDNGIGIGRKAQQQLFKEFYRSDNAINSKIVGSGIGLLLVKNYVSLHDGTVSCESQEGVGSLFKIVIPRKEVLISENSFENVNEEVELNIANIFPETLISDMKWSQKEMKILIVEDNDDLRNFMRFPLGEDFEVNVAEDGAQAWEIIQKDMPDLVVSDVMMPNMDGFELCELMKATYETSHIPIILLTALSERTEQLRGLGLGADDYLTKPFDMGLLSQRIKSIILNREKIRERALKLITVNDSEPILANENNDKFVKKALVVVHENIANSDFGKDEFASAMNVSASLLYKKIKALTDQSPVDFIKTIRLNYSLELLKLKKYTITEISELCGFASVGYFSTVFRKHFGKSPSDLERF